MLATGNEKVLLNKLATIPLLSEKRVSEKHDNPQKHDTLIEHVLAAVGAAWALGISPQLISAGIETFTLS